MGMGVVLALALGVKGGSCAIVPQRKLRLAGVGSVVGRR